MLLILAGVVAGPLLASPDDTVPGRWTEERANQWYDRQPWLVGCNFTPSTAINQLEMWQAETFDSETIDHFLGIAEKHGIRTMLVLCNAVWDSHPKLGRQPEPVPHVHNSGWVQSPHIEILRDPARHDSRHYPEANAWLRSLRPGLIASGNWWEWGKKGTPFVGLAVTETRHFPTGRCADGRTR